MSLWSALSAHFLTPPPEPEAQIVQFPPRNPTPREARVMALMAVA